jgi:peptidoglycan/LPS O-acetylase OafA/YrhL
VTTAFGLLLGSAVAVGYADRRLGPWLERSLRSAAVAWAAAAALLALLAAFPFTPPSMDGWYGPLAALAAAALIGHIVAPASESSAVTRMMSTKPATWLGAISYGGYLWHFPILIAATALLALSGLPLMVVVTGTTIGAAWLSFRYFETPLRNYGRRITTAKVITLDAAPDQGSGEAAEDARVLRSG